MTSFNDLRYDNTPIVFEYISFFSNFALHAKLRRFASFIIYTLVWI